MENNEETVSLVGPERILNTRKKEEKDAMYIRRLNPTLEPNIKLQLKV